MAADSLAARRAVREHLEANFEEYLSSVSTYLRQAYPELQLSTEVSEEIAATVIVRVSHSNPEPTDIEKALCKSADDVVRSRRPRLSQARLLDEMNGPLRSEFPRALPSLRLIQSFSRAPTHAQDSETPANAGFAQGTRLMLANPPVDLGASIGFGGAFTAEREPSFGPGRNVGESLAPSATSEPAYAKRSVDEPEPALPSVSPKGGVASAASKVAPSPEFAAEDEHAGFESGTLHEVATVEDSRIDVRRPNLDEDFFGDDSPDGEGPVAAVESAPLGGVQPEPAPSSRSASAAASEGLGSDGDDESAPDSEREWGALRSEPARAAEKSEPEVDVDAGFDEAEVAPEAAAESAHVFVAESVSFHEPQSGGALFGMDKLSSIPPTKESLVPGPVSPSESKPGADQVPGQALASESSGAVDSGSAEAADDVADEPRRRTRRKVVRRSKKSSTKKASRSASSKSAGKATPKRRSPPKRAPAPARPKAPTLGAPQAPSGQFVPDDLAIIAMLGFPDNPKRAAKLCVMAMCEELGLDGLVEIGPMVTAVTAALDELRVAFEGAAKLPADAHLRWQRTARQATLRACMTNGK